MPELRRARRWFEWAVATQLIWIGAMLWILPDERLSQPVYRALSAPPLTPDQKGQLALLLGCLLLLPPQFSPRWGWVGWLNRRGYYGYLMILAGAGLFGFGMSLGGVAFLDGGPGFGLSLSWVGLESAWAGVLHVRRAFVPKRTYEPPGDG